MGDSEVSTDASCMQDQRVLVLVPVGWRSRVWGHFRIVEGVQTDV
jgi:hypothetical protein